MTKSAGITTVTVNRAPVLTLWVAVVAKRLGFEWEEALTLGRALAGLNAQTKGQRLGLFTPGGKRQAGGAHRKAATGKPNRVELFGREVPTTKTPEGIRALSGDKPMAPDSVQRYLDSKFGESLPATRAAMEELAGAFPPPELAENAYALYERFRPTVPKGQRGWGAKGVLDLETMRELAKSAKRAAR